MKTSHLLLSSALLLACLSGCNMSTNKQKAVKTDDGSLTTVKTSENELTVCKLSAVKDTIDVPLSELIEDCRIIRFDNSDEALFKAWSINVTDNYIGVRQREQDVFKLFDKNGKFLHNVGSIGGGPGEYDITLYDECIDEKNGHIFFTPFVGKKIMMYDINGNWIKDIPMPSQINKAKIWVNNDGTLSIVHMPFEEGKPLAFTVDTDGNIVKEIPATAATKVRNFDGEVFSYRNCNDFDFFHTSIDTLFTYDAASNRLVPRFTMTFLNPEEKPVHIFYRLPNHFIITYYYWGKNGPEGGGNILVDTQKKASSHFRLVNDFYGNLPVSSPGHRFYRGYFVQDIEPGQLITQIENHLASGKCPSKDKQKLQDLIASLDENDNNVLFIGKLKQ